MVSVSYLSVLSELAVEFFNVLSMNSPDPCEILIFAKFSSAVDDEAFTEFRRTLGLNFLPFLALCGEGCSLDF